MPMGRVAAVVGVTAGLGLTLAILSWVAQWRVTGAVLMAVSLAPALIAVLVAAPLGAGRIARQLHSPTRLSRIDELAPRDAASDRSRTLRGAHLLPPGLAATR